MKEAVSPFESDAMSEADFEFPLVRRPCEDSNFETPDQPSWSVSATWAM
jgi:hypothetical protein